jgi:hypothetical protein
MLADAEMGDLGIALSEFPEPALAGGGFEQCYDAQAVVDTESMRILAPHVTPATNDKEQVAPMVPVKFLRRSPRRPQTDHSL